MPLIFEFLERTPATCSRRKTKQMPATSTFTRSAEQAASGEKLLAKKVGLAIHVALGQKGIAIDA